MKRSHMEHAQPDGPSQPPFKKSKTAKKNHIKDLPTEMLVMILENVPLHELVSNCSKTCIKWREIVALFIMKEKVNKLATTHLVFKIKIEQQGWSKDCTDIDLILSLYGMYEYNTSKYLLLL